MDRQVESKSVGEKKTGLGLEPSIEPPRIHAIQGLLNKLAHRVASIDNVLDTYDSRISGIEEALAQIAAQYGRVAKPSRELYNIALLVGEWKKNTCRFNRNGVCTLWRIQEDVAKKTGIDFVVEGETARPKVDKTPILCALCPLYQPA